MLSAIIEDAIPATRPFPNERIVDRIPARRLGQASEGRLHRGVFASDETSYVSGSAIHVDGGTNCRLTLFVTAKI